MIPTRQRHQTLAYAIQSVLFQDYPDFELVVMDNCSSGETWVRTLEARARRAAWQ